MHAVTIVDLVLRKESQIGVHVESTYHEERIRGSILPGWPVHNDKTFIQLLAYLFSTDRHNTQRLAPPVQRARQFMLNKRTAKTNSTPQKQTGTNYSLQPQ